MIITKDEAQQLAFKEAIKISNNGSSDGLSLLIDRIYNSLNNRTCENCKHGGLSTMGYTDCLNKNVNYLWNDKRLPDDMNCKQWELR